MHAMWLTLLVLGGGETAGSVIVQPGVGEVTASSCDCGRAFVGHLAAKHDGHGMPQTCYNPRFGCYPGNDRHTNRYPAFHGSYYRRPYNYRQLFDFPWHAELHEPTSLFSYNVDGEAGDSGADGPPVPPAASAQRAPASRVNVRAADRRAAAGSARKAADTIRD
jgi:hypothetical protein